MLARSTRVVAMTSLDGSPARSRAAMRIASTPSELGRNEPRKLAASCTRKSFANPSLMPRTSSSRSQRYVSTMRSSSATAATHATQRRSTLRSTSQMARQSATQITAASRPSETSSRNQREATMLKRGLLALAASPRAASLDAAHPQLQQLARRDPSGAR